jgi:hypothetical protein
MAQFADNYGQSPRKEPVLQLLCPEAGLGGRIAGALHLGCSDERIGSTRIRQSA